MCVEPLYKNELRGKKKERVGKNKRKVCTWVLESEKKKERIFTLPCAREKGRDARE